MEVMDLFSPQKEQLDQTHPREIPLTEGNYRFVVTVLIFNTKGQLLIQ